MRVHSMNRTQPRCKDQNYTVELHNNSFNSPHKAINKSIVVILLSMVATQSKTDLKIKFSSAEVCEINFEFSF